MPKVIKSIPVNNAKEAMQIVADIRVEYNLDEHGSSLMDAISYDYFVYYDYENYVVILVALEPAVTAEQINQILAIKDDPVRKIMGDDFEKHGDEKL